MMVRFGGVPGVEEAVPALLLEQAFTRADAGWRIERTRAVNRTSGRSSVTFPFPMPAGRPVDEVEVYARLEK